MLSGLSMEKSTSSDSLYGRKMVSGLLLCWARHQASNNSERRTERENIAGRLS